MSQNIEKSTSLIRMVEDITHLKQLIEYFERHVHKSEMKKQKRSIFEHWLKFWRQKNRLCHFDESQF